ncbi:M13 family metallopeptidase [Corynebacterium amycolatum]|uniref:M13 family metallopeptidase n=1 Tax=Corynebacterium amycolatum TaxID=43765 RepID=UPI003B5B8DA3
MTNSTNTETQSATSQFSTTSRPQDDLYLATNGEWISNHVIPADRPIDGAFYKLRDEAEENVRELITTAADADPNSRVARLYNSFMDEAAINDAGAAPLAQDLEMIASAENAHELALALGRLDRLGVGGALGYWVEKDSGSDLDALYLLQSGLGLPDEAYYREPGHADTLAAYEQHVAAMLKLLSSHDDGTGDLSTALAAFELVDPAAAAARIVAFEKRIAAGHWNVVDTRNALKTYNKTAIADLPTGFPVAEWLAATGVNETNQTAIDTIVVMMPSYFEHLSKLWQDTDLADLRLWALWRVLHQRAAYLSDDFSAENFNFYGRTLQGSTEQRARWKRGVAFADGAVGHDVGKLYVEKHFPPEYKEQVLELVDYLLAAYRERISKLPWMTKATQERALEKLSLFKAKIGYPERWRDYSAMELGDSLMENARAASAFAHDYEVAKLGTPTDRDEWHGTPQTVNAFYNPVVNDITFPAAILQSPFFSPDASPAENFGGIGAVIGHEIGHGFDDQGSQYDGHGNLHQWWTDEDRAAFEKLTAALVDQYEGLVPQALREQAEEGADLPGVNGRFTLGENIGDLGGLGIAVVAFRRFLAARGEELGLEDTPETYRDLFKQWALVWRSKIRPEFARQLLAIDPHSPAEFRCNVIASNIDEFHEAFDTSAGDGMWREPNERVNIW